MSDGARALGEVGDDLVHRPGVLPGKAQGWLRRWLARIWTVRGGGLYALGYAATFAYLEVRTLLGEVASADSVGDFFTGQLFEFVFRFMSDSILNMVRAFIWPIDIIQFWPPVGAIGLGIAFLLFDQVLRKPIEDWLNAGSE